MRSLTLVLIFPFIMKWSFLHRHQHNTNLLDINDIVSSYPRWRLQSQLVNLEPCFARCGKMSLESRSIKKRRLRNAFCVLSKCILGNVLLQSSDSIFDFCLGGVVISNQLYPSFNIMSCYIEIYSSCQSMIEYWSHPSLSPFLWHLVGWCRSRFESHLQSCGWIPFFWKKKCINDLHV